MNGSEAENNEYSKPQETYEDNKPLDLVHKPKYHRRPVMKRIRILRYLKNNPGSHYRKIFRDLDISRGCLSYHLKNLEEGGKIFTIRTGPYKFYYTGEDQIMREPFTPMQKRIIQILATRNSNTYKKLSERLDKSQESLMYHMKRLKERDMVVPVRHGNTVHWFLTKKNDV